MPRNTNLPLTETAYYILLALVSPAHGYAIMQAVERLSAGDVRLAAGTLYGALENLLAKGLILAQPSDDPRRKVYVLSPAGRRALDADAQRMQHMLAVTGAVLEEGEPRCAG